jgi:regulator of RNase E activity RraA
VPGDIVVGDGEGVIVIPLRHLDLILERVRAWAARERSHHGASAGGRKEYDAFYDMAFAQRVADGSKPPGAAR